MLKKIIIAWFMFLSLNSFVYAQNDDGLGQTIQIYTHFNRIVGRATWLIVIRDIDRGENVPYLFDIMSPNNFFLIFTHSRHYTIVASRMQFSPYHRFPYSQCRIANFCNLESRGRIIRGQSMTISVQGDLTPNQNNYLCDKSMYREDFTIVDVDAIVKQNLPKTMVAPAPASVVVPPATAATVVTPSTSPVVVSSPAPVVVSSQAPIAAPASSVSVNTTTQTTNP